MCAVVISVAVHAGGVGFDINCGVRLVRTNLFEKDVRPIKEQLAQVLGTCNDITCLYVIVSTCGLLVVNVALHDCCTTVTLLQVQYIAVMYE